MLSGRADNSWYHCAFFLGKVNTCTFWRVPTWTQPLATPWQPPGNPRALRAMATPSPSDSPSNKGPRHFSNVPPRPLLLFCFREESNRYCLCSIIHFLTLSLVKFRWKGHAIRVLVLCRKSQLSAPHPISFLRSPPLPCPPEREKEAQQQSRWGRVGA